MDFPDLVHAMTPKRSSNTQRLLSATLVAGLLCTLPQVGVAGEGGTSHLMPGAMATLADNPPTGSLWFVKPMYMHYEGRATAQIPTASGLAANLQARSNTLALAVGYAFETPVLGATWTAVVALPFTQLDLSGDVRTGAGNTVRRIGNDVSGLGDLTLIPVMLAWKDGPWQYNALVSVYAPTGSYQLGRLGNTGLNYWTFDPAVGVTYSDAKRGFNALAFLGYAMNTTNSATDYRSGSLLHLDAAVQQVLPMGSGFATVGLEGFWFDQTTCDTGDGATLGCFKGRTAGLGPVLGYIQPLSKTEQLVFELKWLSETSTRNRVEGDSIWFKTVYKF